MIDKLIKAVEERFEELLNGKVSADPKFIHFLSQSIERLETVKTVRIDRLKKEEEEDKHKSTSLGFGGIEEEKDSDESKE